MIKGPTFCVNIPLWRLCQQASGETHTISRWSIYSTSPIIIIRNIMMWWRKGYRIWNISDNVSFNRKNLEVYDRSHVTGVCRRCTWPGCTWSSCTSSPSPFSPSSTSWSTCQWPWSLVSCISDQNSVTFLFLCIAVHEYDAPGRSGRPRQFVILSPAARKEKLVRFFEIFWIKIQIHANRIGNIAVWKEIGEPL